jgi:hypothetical protein
MRFFFKNGRKFRSQALLYSRRDQVILVQRVLAKGAPEMKQGN